LNACVSEDQSARLAPPVLLLLLELDSLFPLLLDSSLLLELDSLLPLVLDFSHELLQESLTTLRASSTTCCTAGRTAEGTSSVALSSVFTSVHAV